MTFEASQKFMEEIQVKDFDTSAYDYVYQGFQFEEFNSKEGKKISIELSPMQDQLLKYAEEFEKMMKER